jgi:HSP20 family protein
MADWPAGVQVDEGFTELGPPIDVRDTEDAYIVEIDMPGADPEDTEVFIEGRTLTVRGRFCDETEHQEGNYLLRERRHGEFTRAVALPGMVDVNDVTSTFENGRLTITLPKATQNRARRIDIGPGNGSQTEARSGNGSRTEANSGNGSRTEANSGNESRTEASSGDGSRRRASSRTSSRSKESSGSSSRTRASSGSRRRTRSQTAEGGESAQ